MLKILYKLLNLPLIYKLSQLVFAPGANKKIQAFLQSLVSTIPRTGRVLDVGCGPASFLWKLDWQPIGLDISYIYAKEFHKAGQLAITGSCIELPFADKSFDVIWTIGVLHHLQNIDAKKTVSEIFRVCKNTGYVIILDAVLPDTGWKKPIASLIRKMDRGKFMRKQKELDSFMPKNSKYIKHRFTYAHTGLEMLAFVCQ